MITSIKNDQIKYIKKLRQKKYSLCEKKIIVEGEKPHELALKNRVQFDRVYVNVDYMNESLIHEFSELKIPVIHVDKKVFKHISYGDYDNGIVSIAKRPLERSYESLLRVIEHPLIIILDQVEKPGNIGAVLRTADSQSVTAVFLCDSQTDLYNPNMIRSSMGTCFSVPVFDVSFDEMVQCLSSFHITAYILAPQAKENYFESSHDYQHSVAFIAGNEHDGVQKKWLNSHHKKIRIPMRGSIDSLNVSVSVTVLVFEAMRQRHQLKGSFLVSSS